MRKWNKDKASWTRIRRGALPYGERVLALAERSLETADHVDDQVRRWLFPVTYGRGTSSPRDGVPIRRPSLPRDVQDAIGRQLRAECPLEQSMPAPLANLFRQFEGSGKAAPMRPGVYPSAA